MTAPVIDTSPAAALQRAAKFPRLRFMGSKYRLLPHLAGVFAELGGRTALDAFSGSGVVSYLLKAQGYQVTANDFMAFPWVIARATTVNQSVRLTAAEIGAITGPAADDRDFIRTTFAGLYFTADDREFLDSAWSHIDPLPPGKQAMAISALVLSAARRQPRGVFTFTDAGRYDDGRRDLSLSLREHFRERAVEYNGAVFATGRPNRAIVGDVYDLDPGDYDLVYLDPPYAPPRDDADYMKRYHFLEGLAVYWRGQEIMPNTETKKIVKKYTPFAYRRSVVEAMRRVFDQFRRSTLVLSYSSNAVPDLDTLVDLLKVVKRDVRVVPVAHTYSFGTHRTATRRAAAEYIIVAR